MVRLFDPLPSLKTFIHIGGEMVSVFASSAVDRGFESRSGHKGNNKITELRTILQRESQNS